MFVLWKAKVLSAKKIVLSLYSSLKNQSGRSELLKALILHFYTKSALYLTAFASFYYLIQVRHHPFLYILILFFPVSLLNYLIFHYLTGRIKSLLLVQKKVLIAEMLILILLFAVGFVLLNKIIFYIGILIFWIWAMLLLRKPAFFLAGYAGLLIFFTLVLSRYALVEEERGLVYIRSYYIRLQHENSLVSWEGIDPDGRQFLILRRGKPVLKLNVPEGVFFHGPDKKKPGLDYPEPGIPTAFLSSSQDDPEVFPAVWIFLLGDEEYEAEGFKGDFNMFLGYKKNTGEITRVNFLGKKEFRLQGIVMSGLFWEYTSLSGLNSVTGLYLLKTKEANFILIVHDLPQEGFPHHTKILQILEGISF